MTTDPPQEYLKAFMFVLEADGKDLGLVSATLEVVGDVTTLVLTTGVHAGKRRLQMLGHTALSQLITVRSLGRGNEDLERVVFASSKVAKYVYGKWHAERNEVLLEELHLEGAVVGIFT